jgi:hypothetical protein
MLALPDVRMSVEQFDLPPCPFTPSYPSLINGLCSGGVYITTIYLVSEG